VRYSSDSNVFAQMFSDPLFYAALGVAALLAWLLKITLDLYTRDVTGF
jgi:hypothetical protein